ncbi:MAG: adenylate kinase [Sedimentisphaerales bacterium]|nr:adenylate kinase [Sedimentisphaerales bacterium]
MRVVLLGAPGAGKGTQCKNIIQKYDLVHLSSGDILRQHREKGTQLANKAKDYMDSGALVPDELIVEMMLSAINEAPKAGFVLDGFPRTVNQAVELDEALAATGEKVDIVLNLTVHEQVIIERLSGRRSCPKCGAVYHVVNLKPKVDNLCDNDGTELIQRPDDNPDVVKNRLRTYHRQSKPVVDYYKSRQTEIQFYEFNANEAAEKVRDSLFEKLDALVSVQN